MRHYSFNCHFKKIGTKDTKHTGWGLYVKYQARESSKLMGKEEWQKQANTNVWIMNKWETAPASLEINTTGLWTI